MQSLPRYLIIDFPVRSFSLDCTVELFGNSQSRSRSESGSEIQDPDLDPLWDPDLVLDPDPDSDGIKRNIDHVDSIELDRACVKKGFAPPLLTSHQYIIDQQKSELNSDELNDVSRMLVKFSILEGDLNKFIIDATDPSGPGGEKMTQTKKKKIFESIKKIEDKILKIKLSIDKSS